MNRNKVVKIWANYYIYIVTFVISVVVLFVSMVSINAEPFGELFPLKGNGFIQDYANFMDGVNRINDGKGFDILDYGIGLVTDNYSGRAYSILGFVVNPITFILIKIVPESLYTFVFLLIYIFYFSFSGVAFIIYLTHRLSGENLDKNDPILIVFGVVYNLSAYSINYFMYSGFGFLLFMPLLFLGIERVIYKNKICLYTLVLCYFMASQTYYAFIACMFIVVYYITLKHKSIKDFIINGIKVVIPSIIAAGLSAAFLIPFYARTRYSPYGSYDEVSPSIIKWFSNPLYPISDFRVLPDAYITNSFEYKANIYCGIFMLMLLPLYAYLNKKSKWEKITRIAVIVLIYLSFDNQLLNYVFHGFHYQWQVPNRIACFFIFFVMISVYEVIVYFKELSYKTVLTSMGISAFLLISSYILQVIENGMKVISFIPSIAMIAMYFVLLLINNKMGKNWFLKVSLIILSIEVITSGIFSFRKTLAYEEASYERNYISQVRVMTQRHQDMCAPFVITERVGNIFDQNMSYMQGTHSISYYTSVSYHQQFDLMYRWGMLFSKNITYYYTGSPLLDMMLHVKYHTTDASLENEISPYAVVDQSGNIRLHANPYYLPLGVALFENDELKEWESKSGSYGNYESPFDRDNAFAHCFGVDDIYSKVDIANVDNYASLDEIDCDNLYQKTNDLNGNGYLTFDLDNDLEGNVYISIAQALIYVGKATKGEDNILYLYIPRYINIDEEVTIAVWNEDNFSKLHDILDDTIMSDVTYNSSSITGSITLADSRVVYLAMPYLPGFKAYVNGSEVELLSYMDGMAIRLPKGEYNIELKYTPEGMKEGLVISSVFVVIFFVYIMLLARYAKKSILVGEERE